MLLRKGVYPYEYIDKWEIFDETSFSDKKAFYINWNIKGIKNVNYRHAKIVFKYFNNKDLDDYHDLYVQIYTLILADEFENFWNKYIEIYELDRAHFLSVHRLTWKVVLKKSGVKLELLTNNNMSMMAEKGIRDGICHVVYRYAKATNKNM